MSQYGAGNHPQFSTTPLPGWYPDPGGAGQRWWDGRQWTHHHVAAPAGYAAPATGTNGLAVASLVLGIVWVFWLGSILAVVFGHVALHQISSTRQGGRGMAAAGLVLGYLGLAGLALLVTVAAVNGHAVTHCTSTSGQVVCTSRR